MTKLMKMLVVCALLIGMQYGFGLPVSWAAPTDEGWQQREQQAWIMKQEEFQALKQQEIQRHEMAMLQRENESVSDWEWRKWQEHELHIRNMQKIQEDQIKFVGTPINW